MCLPIVDAAITAEIEKLTYDKKTFTSRDVTKLVREALGSAVTVKSVEVANEVNRRWRENKFPVGYVQQRIQNGRGSFAVFRFTRYAKVFAEKYQEK